MQKEKARTQTHLNAPKSLTNPKMPEIKFRKATVHDTSQIKSLVKMFHEEYISDLGFDMSDLVFQKIATTNILASTWVAHLPDESIPAKYSDKPGENGVMIAKPDTKFGEVIGVFSGYYTTYILDNAKLFHEIVWYVHPDHRRCGLTLYKHCEEAIKGQGAKKMVMIHMANEMADDLSSLYKKMGYAPLETHYVKSL